MADLAELATAFIDLRRARFSPERAERLRVSYLTDADEAVVDEVERILEHGPAAQVLDLVRHLLMACNGPDEQAQVGISELEDVADERPALFAEIRPAILALDGGLTALRAGFLLAEDRP